MPEKLSIIATFLAYASLCLTILLLWFPRSTKTPPWVYAFGFSMGFAFLTGVIELIALPTILLLAITTYYSQNPNVRMLKKLFATATVLTLSFMLAAQLLPGFNNVIVLDHVRISQEAIPFTMYMNFDKALVGVFILGFGPKLMTKYQDWRRLVRKLIKKIPLLLAIILIFCWLLQYVKLDPKFPSSFFIFALNNLLLVSVAEEALFRAFIQRKLAHLFKDIKEGNYFAIIIAAVIFGFTHYMGGIRLVLLATVAGMAYGWVFYKTKRIEGSILTHFSFNIIHFLFFTYPALNRVM